MCASYHNLNELQQQLKLTHAYFFFLQKGQDRRVGSGRKAV